MGGSSWHSRGMCVHASASECEERQPGSAEPLTFFVNRVYYLHSSASATSSATSRSSPISPSSRILTRSSTAASSSVTRS